MAKNRLRRGGRRWLSCTAAGLVTVSGAGVVGAWTAPAVPSALERQALLPEFDFHYDYVLGTSLDMTLEAPSREVARECERQILAEIDRLSAILSTYDPSSEISDVMKGGSVRSAELFELLALYDLWTVRTGGAVQLNLAGVKELWNNAARDNRMPDGGALRGAFQIPRSYNVDALGKGFIIDRAVEIARRIAPSGLLNIGGDIRVWGERTWSIGIANPMDYADNAPPLAVFPLRNAAVASSGGYARYFEIKGRRYSHIIDPRTLWPVEGIHRSSTVVASDCITGNALSTAMCVLDASAVDELVTAHADGHLTVRNDRICRAGTLARADVCMALAVAGICISPENASAKADPTGPHSAPAPSPLPAMSVVEWYSGERAGVRGETFTFAPAAPFDARLLTPTLSPEYGGEGARDNGAPHNSTPQAHPLASAMWPKDYRLEINLVLKQPTGPKIKRSYVVVWIENESGKPVRNITLWGRQDKYLPHLSTWWKLINMNVKGAQSMAAATRPAGKYTLYWDGRDDFGKLQPQGKYKVRIEISREHGSHAESTVGVDCSGKPDSQTAAGTAESEESKIEYKRGSR